MKFYDIKYTSNKIVTGGASAVTPSAPTAPTPPSANEYNILILGRSLGHEYFGHNIYTDPNSHQYSGQTTELFIQKLINMNLINQNITNINIYFIDIAGQQQNILLNYNNKVINMISVVRDFNLDWNFLPQNSKFDIILNDYSTSKFINDFSQFNMNLDNYLSQDGIVLLRDIYNVTSDTLPDDLTIPVANKRNLNIKLGSKEYNIQISEDANILHLKKILYDSTGNDSFNKLSTFFVVRGSKLSNETNIKDIPPHSTLYPQVINGYIYLGQFSTAENADNLTFSYQNMDLILKHIVDKHTNITNLNYLVIRKN
jgi:hypothetical protein